MGEIRTLREDEMEESLRLSEFAFQIELTPEARTERLAVLNPEETLGYFDGGKLAAKLNLLPLEVWVNGKAFAMGGIAGVATWPEYRRGGLVAKLLGEALKTMREQGRTLSFLHPFNFGFYRKYGWEAYVEYKKYELEPAQLRSLRDPGGRVVRTEDAALLNSIYEQFAVRFNGTLLRSGKWWDWNIFRLKKVSGTAAVYYDPAGDPKGYVIYKVKERRMTVGEFVYLDEEARLGLLAFIRNHDSMADKAELQAPASDCLSFLLENPRIKQEIVPYFMARIVDAAGFLKRSPFAPMEGSFRLQVKDGFAPWNEGVYTVRVKGGQADVRLERNGQEGTKDDLLSCDIGTLTALMLGYQRPAYLKAAGYLAGSQEAVDRLEALIPRRETYLLDFF